MQWLSEKGYPQPEETHINSFLGYATRWYRIPEGVEIEPPGVLVQVGAQSGLYRGAAAARIEDGQVIITLAGQSKDFPPTDEAGFLGFARSLPDPKIYEWIQMLDPVTPIQGYRAANRLRHYERLKRYPEQFIVMGDTACILNPIYGQGMTSAALRAQMLDRMLARQDVCDLSGFARRFQKGVWRVMRILWLLATGEDRRFPLVEGPPPNVFDRIVHRYVDLLFLAAAQDSAIANALLRTMQLLDHPIAMSHFHPPGRDHFGYAVFNYEMEAFCDGDILMPAKHRKKRPRPEDMLLRVFRVADILVTVEDRAPDRSAQAKTTSVRAQKPKHRILM